MKANLLLGIIMSFVIVNVNAQDSKPLPKKEVSHTFYATGNLATAKDNASNPVLKAIASRMQKDQNSSLILLGNNASTNGFTIESAAAKQNLDSYSAILKPFADRMVFIPGFQDWKQGLDGLKDQEDYVEQLYGNKDIFQPEKSCPIEKIEINENVDLLILDSQWALSNFNKYPGINDACEIKTKTDFYIEVEHEIIKSQGKTVLLAASHPIESYGKYGKSLYFGIDPQNLNNNYYEEFRDRLLTIARQSKNVVFLAGHERNMQFISDKEVPVIISGAGGSIGRGRKGRKSICNFNQRGFSKITEYKDGSMWVSFYGDSDNYSQPLYNHEIITPEENLDLPDYNEKSTPQTVEKAIYTDEEVARSGFYKKLWGQHFRKDYNTKINLKTALLDTLYGGLSVVRKGGGHQTNSLRLVTKEGKEYTMRSAKKSSLRFLQYFIFKTQYLRPEVGDTYVLKLLEDYWTTAYPYGSLTIGELSDAIDVYHANTELFYIPKQKTLGKYNDNYGDEIYFVEERLTDGLGDEESLGYNDKIESTLELIHKLRRKDKIEINESRYIRSRLFDNVVGDWDRHEDQWRWGVKELEDGTKHYEPLPRDRDQVYSDFDGAVLGIIRTLNPPLRFMQRYNSKYKHTKWFNDAGDEVDLAVLKNHTQEDWLREAAYIKENLTEDIVNKAFENLPKEIDQAKVERTKKALLGRIANINDIAVDLFEDLRATVLITGTDKDDHFVITRKPNGITNVSIYRLKDGEKDEKYWDVDYDKTVTNELWIYGLDKKDIFEVTGDGDKFVKVKIIGGQDNDTYRIANKRKVHIYDHQSKPNTFETKSRTTLSDNYDLNTHYYLKNRRDITSFTPIIASNPDDGLRVGGIYNYTKNSLRRNPFTASHNLTAIYISETSGVILGYSGEFANIFNAVNFGFDANYTSPSFAVNFFGFGNETDNFDDDQGRDFNRVRLQTLSFAPSLIFRGYQGSKVKVGVNYEFNEVERTGDRFIDDPTTDVNPEVFEGQNFFGAEASYQYDNFDNPAFPRSGLGFKLTTGYKTNLDESGRSFGYIIPEFRFTTRLDPRGILVYSTKIKAHFNLGNDFEFYQAATIGDADGLRGFRRQRFSGKSAFYQNSDLRLSLGRLNNSILPTSFGIYGGVDYGRVYLADDDSNKIHVTPGGGFFFNLAGLTTANFGYFGSEDGGRLNILLTLAF